MLVSGFTPFYLHVPFNRQGDRQRRCWAMVPQYQQTTERCSGFKHLLRYFAIGSFLIKYPYTAAGGLESDAKDWTRNDLLSDGITLDDGFGRIELRVAAWQNGNAICQEISKNSICRFRSACPSRKVLQPIQSCRVVNRPVFGRTMDDDSITSRSGPSRQGVCCQTEISIQAADRQILSSAGSEIDIAEETNQISTAGLDDQINPSFSSIMHQIGSGSQSFDIMPYAALMAQSANLTNMLLGAAQVKSIGRTQHKNFTEFNLADLGLDCGKRNLTYKMMRLGRIVGGETAGFSDWPWVAMVLNYGRPRCGGTLLSPQAVLTAAHCVSGNMLLYNLTVRIGMFNTNERENLPFPPLLLRVDRIIRHPNFDLTTLLNDVAILVLSHPVVFAPNILPACIASQEYPANTPTTILGWGKEEENNTVYDLPDSLQAVTVPIINRADCKTYFNAQGLMDLIGVQHICAGSDDGGKDACQGDSGGPMLLENPDGRFELLGIISWGFGCGEPHVPGVYTNIFNYRQWIIDTIRQLS